MLADTITNRTDLPHNLLYHGNTTAIAATVTYNRPWGVAFDN